jgi:peptide deformylase
MASDDLLVEPNPILRLRSSVVDDFFDEKELFDIIQKMLFVMRSYGGVGIAAPQIGSNVRVIAMDSSCGDRLSDTYIMINPELESVSILNVIEDERCLSLPGYSYEVSRPESIMVSWIKPGSKSKIKKLLQGFEARIFLHELHHLDGILISDIASRATLIDDED